MIDFKQIWRRATARFKGRISSQDSQEPGGDLPARRDENRALQAELDNVRQQVVQASDEGARKLADLQRHVQQANDEGAHKLADMQQRVELAESESNQMQQNIQVLRTELADTAARQNTAETRARDLEAELTREHNKQKEMMHLLRDRELELERRAGRTMWIASAALLLGAVTSTTVIWGVRGNDRMLAELGKDIRDIKLSMTQQPARNLSPPVAEAFDAPAAAVTSTSVSVPEAHPVQPAAIDRQPLLPYPVALNNEYADTLSRTYESRWDTKAFFVENAQQWGVMSLANGTQYRVLGKGNGRMPSASDKVIVSYRAFTLDGKEFDSTYADQDVDAATFNIDEVMPGWKEALLRMEEGAQWELYIPPDLAHTGRTRKRSMLGYKPLIYVIELKSVVSDQESGQDE